MCMYLKNMFKIYKAKTKEKDKLMHNSSWRLDHSSISNRIKVQKVSKGTELNSTVDQLDRIDTKHSTQQQKCPWHTDHNRPYPVGS